MLVEIIQVKGVCLSRFDTNAGRAGSKNRMIRSLKSLRIPRRSLLSASEGNVRRELNFRNKTLQILDISKVLLNSEY